MADELGRNFEREIREQPGVWERLARTDKADQLAETVGGDHDVLLVGSGSSLFMAELGALAFRRRGLQAHWRAATEARLDHRADQGKTVVAISQSGRSSDVLEAVEVLAPRRLVALTNDSGSPLAEAADYAIDIEAGDEKAIPASKSVTATAAILLRAASLLGGDPSRSARALEDTAQAVRAWLDGDTTEAKIEGTIDAARRIARCESVVILGSDYGLPVAREAALKLKEAAYLHAEGFAAGEFRHGSAAMVDEHTAAIGILDEDARLVVGRALAELEPSNATRYTIGCAIGDQIPRLGPLVDAPYNTLAWLVAAQVLALHAARSRGINSDAPRRLTKALVRE